MHEGLPGARRQAATALGRPSGGHAHAHSNAARPQPPAAVRAVAVRVNGVLLDYAPPRAPRHHGPFFREMSGGGAEKTSSQDTTAPRATAGRTRQAVSAIQPENSSGLEV